MSYRELHFEDVCEMKEPIIILRVKTDIENNVL